VSVYTVLDVSTRHITREDAERLRQAVIQTLDPKHPDYLIALDTGYGWLVYSGFSEGDRSQEGAEYSLAFQNLLARSNREGHRWLSLDQDADVEPDLPTFDW
jgi:hypothetical protein